MGFSNPIAQHPYGDFSDYTPGPGQQTFLSGTWPADVMNAGVWSFRFRPVTASGAADWDNYTGLYAQDFGSIWQNNRTLELWANPLGIPFGDIMALSTPLTWAAYATIFVAMNMPAKRMTISGALTGNGVFTWTQDGPYYSNAWPCAGVVGRMDVGAIDNSLVTNGSVIGIYG